MPETAPARCSEQACSKAIRGHAFSASPARASPGIEEKLARIADAGRPAVAAASHHPMTVRVEWLGGITRITLTQHGGAQEEPTEGLTHQAMLEEIEALRSTMGRAPFLVWREHATGTVTWSNRAYLDLVTALHPGAM